MAALRTSALFSECFPTQVLMEKWQGCLVGALVGDCYGKPYKLTDQVSKLQLQKYFEKLDGSYFKAPFKPYSASTSLSNCVARSLIQHNSFDASDIAKKFVKEFFDDPRRDYGNNVSKIFAKLRGSKFADPFGPAKEQYLGLGSFGNAAAARVAPLALFYFMDTEKMVETVAQASNITNANKLARDGAILQSWAIRLALSQPIGTPVDTNLFLQSLIEQVKMFEIDEEGLGLKDAHQYEEQLRLVNQLLSKDAPTEDLVVSTLGHAKVAVYSVPTAIYCFLRGVKEIPGVETSNSFRRTIQYAISLGGDANTIASMAGTIAGACYGYSTISEPLQRHCEGVSLVLDLAQKLANCAPKVPSSEM